MTSSLISVVPCAFFEAHELLNIFRWTAESQPRLLKAEHQLLELGLNETNVFVELARRRLNALEIVLVGLSVSRVKLTADHAVPDGLTR